MSSSGNDEFDLPQAANQSAAIDFLLKSYDQDGGPKKTLPVSP